MKKFTKNILIFATCFFIGVKVFDFYSKKIKNFGEIQKGNNNVSVSTKIFQNNQKLETISRFNIPIYPGAKYISKQNIGINNKTEKHEYYSSSSINEITIWYKRKINNWNIIYESYDDNSFISYERVNDNIKHNFVIVVEEHSNNRRISIITYPDNFQYYGCKGMSGKKYYYENKHANSESAMDAIKEAMKTINKKK